MDERPATSIKIFVGAAVVAAVVLPKQFFVAAAAFIPLLIVANFIPSIWLKRFSTLGLIGSFVAPAFTSMSYDPISVVTVPQPAFGVLLALVVACMSGAGYFGALLRRETETFVPSNLSRKQAREYVSERAKLDPAARRAQSYYLAMDACFWFSIASVGAMAAIGRLSDWVS